MKSNIIILALAVLTGIFSLVSWSIAAHLMPRYQLLSKDSSYDTSSGSGADGGFGSGYNPNDTYGWGSGSSTGSSPTIGSGSSTSSGSGTGSGSTFGSGSSTGSGYGSVSGSGYGSSSGYGSGSSSSYGTGSSFGSGSGNGSGSSYGYSFASTSTSTLVHGFKAPLAVSAVGLAVAILLFLFSPALAMYAWRERHTNTPVPRWLNRTVLGLSVVGFAMSLAMFGVYGHYHFLMDEPAAEAAMLFLAAITGIAATVIPHLPAKWVEKFQLKEQTGRNSVAMETKPQFNETKHEHNSALEQA